MAKGDGFFIEKVIGVSLAAAVIGILLTAPVFCVSQSDGATRQERVRHKDELD